MLYNVTSVKVYSRQTSNFRSHAVSACVSLWCHRPMHAPHRIIHACTAWIAPWPHRPMHAVTAWALLFWFCLRYALISSYFDAFPLRHSSFCPSADVKPMSNDKVYACLLSVYIPWSLWFLPQVSHQHKRSSIIKTFLIQTLWN